ncbi:TPA: alpha-1,2-fucosyltransferase [Photobacterium damselae]
MLIFIGASGLGNQMFQYAFLKSIQEKEERILAFGFENLTEFTNVTDFYFLKSDFFKKYKVKFIIMMILKFLAYIRLISIISPVYVKELEKYKCEDVTIKSKKGLFNVRFVIEGYYQSESFFDVNKIKQLKIKDTYIKKAEEIVNNCISDNHYSSLSFVHIRRGDYLNFQIMGKSAVLPIEYYKHAIELLLKNNANTLFIFLTNDKDYVADEFRYLQNKYISNGNCMGTDLALMTLCNNGILSASSYSWWGSYLMNNRDEVISPKYWLGFNSKIDFQKNSVPSYSKTIDVIDIRNNIHNEN